MTAHHRNWPVFMFAIVLALGLASGASRAEEAKSDTAQVIAANEAFYTAFRSRNMAAMEAIWSKDASASVIHPGWPGINGRKAVMASWKSILEGNPPEIRASGRR